MVFLLLSFLLYILVLDLLTISYGGFFFQFDIVYCFLLFKRYGAEFLNEAYMYHISRGDIRHNFSLWFYTLYLQSGQGLTLLMRVGAFLPQALVQLSTALRYANDPIACCYFQVILLALTFLIFFLLCFFCLCFALLFVWLSSDRSGNNYMCF